jgi:hypothetical protein
MDWVFSEEAANLGRFLAGVCALGLLSLIGDIVFIAALDKK